MTKALGMLASAQNDAEHEGREVRAEEVAKYLADLVICAARFAPHVDLSGTCEARLMEKFPRRAEQVPSTDFAQDHRIERLLIEERERVFTPAGLAMLERRGAI